MNTFKALSKMSGLTQTQVKQIAESVAENYNVLRTCNLHNFSIDLSPEKQLGKTYRCQNCGGEVDGVKRLWYEIGLRHGTGVSEDDLK